MNIRELNKPITSSSLNESLAKKFGTKINVDEFTTEQLEDARNKIRTKLSQTETTESFDSVHNNSNYQKNKLFLDVLNAEIAEREDVAEKDAKPDYLDFDKDGDKKEPMKKALKDKKKKPVDETNEDDNIDAIDNFYDGPIKDKLGFSPTGELMKAIYKGIKAALDAAGVDVDENKVKKAAMNAATTLESKQNKTKETQIIEGKNPTKAHVMKMIKDGKSDKEMMNMHSDADKDKLKAMIKDCKKEMKEIKESKDQGKVIIENYFKSLIEGEEDKAEIVMAAKDMVDRITGWMEDTAEMQTESMLELGDAIRDEMGQVQSESFIAVVKPALESLFTALESTRGALTGGVGQLTGEAEPAVDMGTQNEMPADDVAEPEMEPTVDAEADDFSAAEPAAGGADEAGRAKRESVELSRRLGTILSSKKK